MPACWSGGGAFLSFTRDRAEKHGAVQERVYAAIDEAAGLRAKGRYSEATAVVEAAMEGEWEDDALRREAGDVIIAIGKEEGEAQQRELLAMRKAEMLRELETIGEWVMTQSVFIPMGMNAKASDERYERAFRRHGIDVADVVQGSRVRIEGLRDHRAVLAVRARAGRGGRRLDVASQERAQARPGRMETPDTPRRSARSRLWTDGSCARPCAKRIC